MSSSSSFTIWGCVSKSCFERERVCFEGPNHVRRALKTSISNTHRGGSKEVSKSECWSEGVINFTWATECVGGAWWSASHILVVFRIQPNCGSAGSLLPTKEQHPSQPRQNAGEPHSTATTHRHRHLQLLLSFKMQMNDHRRCIYIAN